MSAGRVILIVLGSIGVLVGLALAAGGGFLLWADRMQREDGSNYADRALCDPDLRPDAHAARDRYRRTGLALE